MAFYMKIIQFNFVMKEIGEIPFFKKIGQGECNSKIHILILINLLESK